ncbi:ArgS-related anticodon-binding protein NrtL [Streptomyces sp. NPDC001941]|uniref:ArgS-related anticodon-binding protein NrtL n=1 Tax=Streptomyces sp. NPDC001941 TaxID=3154659 RepID=UPI0033318B2D
MTPADLSLTVLGAVRRAVEDGALRVAVPDDVKVERPRGGGRGDWASGIALKLARGSGMAPREVAELLGARVRGLPGIRLVEVTGPGFLNFHLEGEGTGELVRAVLGGTGAFEGCGVVAGRAGERALRGHGRDRGFPVPTDVDPHSSPSVRDASRWAAVWPAGARQVYEQRDANPLFRVRYAHARCRALVREAARLGFRGEPGEVPGADAQRLVLALGDWPRAVGDAVRYQEAGRVARQLDAVADALLDFQYDVLPRGDEKPSAAHRARLALAEAAGTVLAGGLSLLGISAPEHL